MTGAVIDAADCDEFSIRLTQQTVRAILMTVRAVAKIDADETGLLTGRCTRATESGIEIAIRCICKLRAQRHPRRKPERAGANE